MKLVILGAGISGLSAAWYLHKKYPHAQISLFEKTNRVGGWIQSRSCGPFLFELGPRTFQTGRCKELLELIRDVGLPIKTSSGGRRYLVKGGKLRSIGSLWPTLIPMLIKDLITQRGPGEDESIASFAQRRFGKEGAELFFDSMALGVYAGDYNKLSVRSCFPFLLNWEQKYGSVIWGGFCQKKTASGLFTVEGGMQRLCEEIVAKVPLDLHLDSQVQEIRSEGILSNGRFFEADQIYCALPAEAAAQLLGEPSPVHMESLHVVNLGYLGEILPKKGYGYLVPTREKESILGMIWDTSIFPVPNQTKVTAMVRGAKPVEIALEAMKRHLGVEKSPDAICHTWAEVPQYELGHAERVKTFQGRVNARFPRVILLGNYLHGASVNACVYRER